MSNTISDIVRLAVDYHNGKVENFSREDSMSTLRQALVELNGGETKLNYRNIRDGKCAELFAVIEEIVKLTVRDGWQNNFFVQNFVDVRNVAEGDDPVFYVEDAVLLHVDKNGRGNGGVRRQRLPGYKKVAVDTQFYTIRVYEELEKLLAGHVDLNHMIDVVGKSFARQYTADVITMWEAATDAQLGGQRFYPTVGNYSEAALLDVIEAVEAAAGKTATLVGTKSALRNLNGLVSGNANNSAEIAREDVYNMGYVGKFYGSPVIALPQFENGNGGYGMSDKIITVIATDDKPIKQVVEGDPIIITGDPLANRDLTQEYLFGQKTGLALAIAANTGIGKYKFN